LDFIELAELRILEKIPARRCELHMCAGFTDKYKLNFSEFQNVGETKPKNTFWDTSGQGS
jgi:hypothetical protein